MITGINGVSLTQGTHFRDDSLEQIFEQLFVDQKTRARDTDLTEIVEDARDDSVDDIVEWRVREDEAG